MNTYRLWEATITYEYSADGDEFREKVRVIADKVTEAARVAEIIFQEFSQMNGWVSQTPFVENVIYLGEIYADNESLKSAEKKRHFYEK